ncbi:phosphatase PAP2 family protein [Streptomyces sp. NPDC004012]
MPLSPAQDPSSTPPPLHDRPSLPVWPAVVLAAAGLLFLLITWQVVAHGPLARADQRIDRDVVRPDRVSGLLADLGNITVAVPVLVIALCWAAWRARRAGAPRWWLPPVAAAGLTAVLPALIVPLKDLIARPGPPVMGPATGFYPSGHTATAAIAYGAAALVLWPWLTAAYARRGLLALCAALNLAVAFGLVRHGYHWPLDVLGSWCLSAVLLCALRLVLGPLLGRGSRPRSGAA